MIEDEKLFVAIHKSLNTGEEVTLQQLGFMADTCVVEHTDNAREAQVTH